MPNPLFAVFPVALLALTPASVPDWEAVTAKLRAQDGQFRQRVTIHVPRVTTTTSTTIILRGTSRAPAMVEKKASDCVKVEHIAGFVVTRNDSVDLILTDGKVLRAKLGNKCPALGFYTGFYVKAAGDKKICARRDAFRSRSGRSCAVEAFRSLVPAK